MYLIMCSFDYVFIYSCLCHFYLLYQLPLSIAFKDIRKNGKTPEISLTLRKLTNEADTTGTVKHVNDGVYLWFKLKKIRYPV